jgi:hypothetical protein
MGQVLLDGAIKVCNLSTSAHRSGTSRFCRSELRPVAGGGEYGGKTEAPTRAVEKALLVVVVVVDSTPP